MCTEQQKSADIGSRIKLIVDVVQGIFTIGAICAAGWWFIAQESTKPEIKIEQTVTQRPLGNSSSEILITVDVRATNIGKTKAELTKGTMQVDQINPIPGYTIHKYQLRDLVLEPGETDHAIFETIRVLKSSQTIQVYSEYPVTNSKDDVWSLYTPVDIGEKPTQKESAASVN
jgi:hypothetical protein